ncbi:MAG TPA: tetratricopeptide repeat protein, partial [Terriglobia bacterium]|nr:tetratricopeptide repeat protein [Terriglobia bacterium]
MGRRYAASPLAVRAGSACSGCAHNPQPHPHGAEGAAFRAARVSKTGPFQPGRAEPFRKSARRRRNTRLFWTVVSSNPLGQDQQSTLQDLIEHGQFSQAQESLSQQIREGSDLFSAYFWLGHLELRQGRTFASIRAYRQAEALQPRNGEVHRLLASDYFLLNQRRLFKEEIQEALAVDPDDQQAYYLAGRFAYEVEMNYAEAVDDLSKASRLNPADSKARYYLALSYGRLNEPDKA